MDGGRAVDGQKAMIDDSGSGRKAWSRLDGGLSARYFDDYLKDLGFMMI